LGAVSKTSQGDSHCNHQGKTCKVTFFHNKMFELQDEGLNAGADKDLNKEFA
jgi:hypothetical protein